MQEKLEAEKEDKLLAEQIKEDIINERKNLIEKKNKEKEKILKYQEINEKLAKERMANVKKDDDIIIEQELINPNSLSSNALKQRINKRALEQEMAGKYLLKIYNSLEKQNQDAYIAEREKQEEKRKLEIENADKKRKLKMEDYRKALQDTLVKKILEKEKQKKEEDKYKQSLEEYVQFLHKKYREIQDENVLLIKNKFKMEEDNDKLKLEIMRGLTKIREGFTFLAT